MTKSKIIEDWEAMYCMSFAIWPNGARDWWSLFKVFMMSWESPFIITQSIPSSAANSTALRATSAFTSVIVKGRGIYWEREAITKPFVILYHISNSSTMFLFKEGTIKINFVPLWSWRLPRLTWVTPMQNWCWLPLWELLDPIFGMLK